MYTRAESSREYAGGEEVGTKRQQIYVHLQQTRQNRSLAAAHKLSVLMRVLTTVSRHLYPRRLPREVAGLVQIPAWQQS